MSKVNESLVPEIRFKGFDGEWIEKFLRQHSKVTMGQSPKSKYYRDRPDNYILIQGNADLKTGKVFPRVWTQQANKFAEKDDIILTVRAPVGETAITQYPSALGRGVCSIKGSYFLYYYLNYLSSIKYWEKISTGSTFQSISSKDVENILLKLPDIQEQQKIGDLFAKMDKLIEKQQDLIVATEKYKKAMIELLYPFRENKVGHTINYEFYSINKIGDLIIKNNRKNINNTITNVESVNNKRGFVSQLDQFDKTVASDNLTNYYIIPPGSFAFNPSRINVGSIGYKEKYEETSIVSPLYVCFQTTDKINDYYLKYWFLSNEFKKNRQMYSEGSVRNSLNYGPFSEINITLPSIETQQKIGNFFKTIDDLIEKQNEKLEAYQQMKKALLQKMFV